MRFVLPNAIAVDGENLTLAAVVAVARHRAPVVLAPRARARLAVNRHAVEAIAGDSARSVYGINTGFGSLKDVAIGPDDLARLQRNLLLSHSAGVGAPLPVEVVRAAMLLRANALAKGVSGVRPEVVETLLVMLNCGVHPYVPAQGSVGASGDLAPLSHLALVLARPAEGEPDPLELSGEVIDDDGCRVPGRTAMERAGIPRLVLEAKEGLALNNGVQVSAALTLLALVDAQRLADLADLACAMTLEAVRGAIEAFLPEVHQLRPFPGQAMSAALILRHIRGSTLAGGDPARVQDGYSIRCAPQVHGAVRDVILRGNEALEIEINSATDNPLIFTCAGRPAISAGQFHGEPIALTADALKAALSELSSISERRIFRLLTRALSYGLPPLLAPAEKPGLGLMNVQFTAAGLVAENKHAARPAAVDNIPTCEDQEDHVSMSPIAARGARRIARNTTYVLAAELLCAGYALTLRCAVNGGAGNGGASHGEQLGEGVGRALAVIRGVVDRYAQGAAPGDCLEEIHQAINAGRFDPLLGEAAGGMIGEG